MRAFRYKQEAREVPMRSLQATGREKHIQSGAKATAKHMILLLPPSVRLELVNGFDRDQHEKCEK
jgi:hypothetical protein